MKSLQSKGIILVVAILMFTINSYGQEINVTQKNKKKNAIVFSPLNLFNPINPTLQIGYERILNEKFALELEGGYIIKKDLGSMFNPEREEDKYNNKGYKLEVELKYLFLKGKRFVVYSSCELFYLNNKSDDWDRFTVSDPLYNYSFEIPDDEYFTYTDDFTNNKIKYGLNFKGGYKIVIGDFLFEAYGGIGIGHVTNKHGNRENINDKSTDRSILNSNLSGSRWFVNLPVNIKVGYIF